MRRGLPAGAARIVPVLALLASAACGPAPTLVKHDLWKDLKGPTPGEYHLLLVWKNPRFGAGDAAALTPEALASAIAAESSSRSLGRLRSYQVVEDYDELAASLPLWRPRAPVLLVEASPASTRSSSSTLVGFGARARYQPFVFDTSTAWSRVQSALEAPWGSKLKARAAEKTRWLADNSLSVCRSFAAALFSALPLEPRPSELKLRKGKGEGMARAYDLALSSGDWAGAAEQWEKEAGADFKNDDALADLSVARELLGDWDGAAAAEEKRKPSLFSSDRERLSMLRGLSLLGTLKGKRFAAPGASVAVLPLDNETPDLQAAEQVRKRLAEALKDAGYAPLDIPALDEKLQKAGFTDAGQLKALTPAKLARLVGADLLAGGSVEEFRTIPLGIYFRREVRATLRVMDGREGKVLFQKTAGTVKETLPGESSELASELVGLIAGKAKNDPLPEESAETSRRFVRPFPHFEIREPGTRH
ncbi:MAG: GNA1162 family protein [Elusimicrobiota bacterium]|jgi:hypothetical protein